MAFFLVAPSKKAWLEQGDHPVTHAAVEVAMVQVNLQPASN